MTALQRLVVEYRSLDDVTGMDENPKTHDIDKIKSSMNRFGYTEPIMLDERTGKLVAGHGRLQSLRELRDAGKKPPNGIGDDWQIPIFRGWSSQNDDEARAYLVASNRLTEIGGWDNAKLVDILTSLDDLDGLGYVLEDLSKLEDKKEKPPPTPKAEWGCIIDCDSEAEQLDVFFRLQDAGFDVRVRKQSTPGSN